MNYAIILQALLATMDLLGRVVESRGYTGEEVEQYIATRETIRQELVKQANNVFGSADGDPEPVAQFEPVPKKRAVVSLPPTSGPSDSTASESRDAGNGPAQTESDTPAIPSPPENDDAADTAPNQG